MWTRKEVKEQGKMAFKANYWKSVIVAFIISILLGGGAGVSSYTGSLNTTMNANQNNSVSDEMYELSDEFDSISDDVQDEILDTYDIDEDIAETAGELSEGAAKGAMAGAIIAGVIIFFVIFIIVFAIVMAINAFILNPLFVGGTRFFTKNLDEPAVISNLGYAFDNNYKNIALTMFFRDLYIMLWTLLFIIPGIVKSYEYRMIPYLLAEDPTMTKDQAFAISKEMMTGNKWNAFVLDLSFIGWYLLGMITLGIVDIFYVSPYKKSTDAALYRKLLMIRSYSYDAQTPVYTENYAQAPVYTENNTQYYSQETNNTDES
ncbi:MAG: DUF975 family protein [Lachnospiraceae bacterium]|nr:DUF975 family protein [Lachnospiraceae bacterium]